MYVNAIQSKDLISAYRASQKSVFLHLKESAKYLINRLSNVPIADNCIWLHNPSYGHNQKTFFPVEAVRKGNRAQSVVKPKGGQQSALYFRLNQSGSIKIWRLTKPKGVKPPTNRALRGCSREKQIRCMDDN